LTLSFEIHSPLVSVFSPFRMHPVALSAVIFFDMSWVFFFLLFSPRCLSVSETENYTSSWTLTPCFHFFFYIRLIPHGRGIDPVKESLLLASTSAAALLSCPRFPPENRRSARPRAATLAQSVTRTHLHWLPISRSFVSSCIPYHDSLCP